ncbi:hypothetical protein Pmani_005144 [Petrolisthes manimaculis]|uniref:Uncharacterized protein n=1 Tax=Petrolisthes manimaculis TaxID=1843537 RepID=A0AAE1UKS6_9EUCA|nr:hypothetical protein Pmani_005144 [Petrolisthes manimaculis]
MGGDQEYQGVLLGVVEVKQSLGNMDKADKVMATHKCYTAVNKAETADPTWTGNVEKFDKAMELQLNAEYINILIDNTLVSRHKLTSISIMAVIPKTGGCLVVVGKCLERNARVGVVLNLQSGTKADQLVHHFQDARKQKKTSMPQEQQSTQSQADNIPQSPPKYLPPKPAPQSIPKIPPPIPQKPAALTQSTPAIPQFPEAPQKLPQKPPIFPPSSPAIPQTPPICTPPPQKPPQQTPNIPKKNSGTYLPPLTFPQNPPSIPPKPPTIPQTPPAIPGNNTNKDSLHMPPLGLHRNAVPLPGLTPVTCQLELPPQLQADNTFSDKACPPHPPQDSHSSTQEDDNSLQNVNDPYYSLTTEYEDPVTCSTSRQSQTSGSTSEEDEEEQYYTVILTEQELSDDEPYYLTIGIDAEEIERIYTRSKPVQKQQSIESREKVIEELLTNERNYICCLNRLKKTRKSLKPELQNLLRGIEGLYDIHDKMYFDLYSGYDSCFKIAEVFTSYQEQLNLYKYHLMNAPKISEKLKMVPEEVITQHPTLKTDIKTTWMRLHYYFMSLERMSESVTDDEKVVMQEAVEMLRNMNKQADSGCLIDAVKDAPFSLHTLGPLLLHSTFLIKGFSMIRKNWTKHEVLLFSDMIVTLIPQKNIFLYRDHFLTKQLNLMNSDLPNEKHFVLELVAGGQKKNKKFTFRSSTGDTKSAWVKELTRIFLENANLIKQQFGARYGLSL